MIAHIVWLACVAFVTAAFAGITAKLPVASVGGRNPENRADDPKASLDREPGLRADARISPALLELIAAASDPHRPVTDWQPDYPAQVPTLTSASGMPVRRQLLPVVLYGAPSGCVAVVLIGLVALMATELQQTARLLDGAAEVAGSATATNLDAVSAVVQSKVASEAGMVVPPAAADDQRSKMAALPVPVPVAVTVRRPAITDQQIPQHRETAQRAVLMAPPVPHRRDAIANRMERPAAREQTAHASSLPQASREMSNISLQLLQARSALESGDTYGARRMMKEAQTLILFEPSSAPAARASGAVAVLTQALMMLSSGDGARALGYLNQALSAVQQVS
jgi:hypothetical protein